MRYDEAIGFLNSFINYEKKKNVNYDEDHYNLDAFKELLKKFDNPQYKIKTIHITGTKGKGSTVEFVKNILMEAGYSVGTFTSPHLVDVRERIRLNNEMISKDDFAYFVEKIKPAVLEREKKYRTFFELITLISFLYFAYKNVDYAVYEVGLGGRLDSTNVVLPEVAIINSIDYEHTELLGNTLLEIASEKGGIIKERKPVVIGPQKTEEVVNFLKEIALKHNAKSIVYGEHFFVKDNGIYGLGNEFEKINMKMLGQHQLRNASLAIAAIKEVTDIDNLTIKKAVENTLLSGRVEVRKIENRTIVLDTAHTIDSIKALFDAIKKNFPDKKVWSIVSFSSGKKIKEMLEIERENVDFLAIAKNSSFRAAGLDEMKVGIKPDAEFETVRDAFYSIWEKADKEDIILIHGSFYLMTDVENILKNFNETIIIKNAQQGNIYAFNELMKRYSSFVKRNALALTNDITAAEEIYQEVFLKAYKNINKFKIGSSFATWLYAILNNEFKMYLRDVVDDKLLVKNQDVIDALSQGNGVSIEAQFEFSELVKKLDNAIDNLPEEYETVFKMRVKEGLSYDEIAKRMNLKRGTVKSKISRAREKLWVIWRELKEK